MNWLAVFIGGGLGSVARYGLSQIWQHTTLTFPIATLSANVSASVIIGVLSVLSIRHQTEFFWLLAATGFCGGMSTFSTFSLETVQLFKDNHHLAAWTNIIISVASCLITVWLISKLPLKS